MDRRESRDPIEMAQDKTAELAADSPNLAGNTVEIEPRAVAPGAPEPRDPEPNSTDPNAPEPGNPGLNANAPDPNTPDLSVPDLRAPNRSARDLGVPEQGEPEPSAPVPTPSSAIRTFDPMTSERPVLDFIEGSFQPAVSKPLLEAGRFLAGWLRQPKTVFGLSVSGPFAEHESGLASLIPLLENGLVDWIVARGEDLYIDAERSLRQAMEDPRFQDAQIEILRQSKVRVLDGSFTGPQLLSTEQFLERLVVTPRFQRIVSSVELNALLGSYFSERDKVLGLPESSVLAVAKRRGVPVFTDSPGGSHIGRLVSASALSGNRLMVDLNKDLNEAAGIVLHAKQTGQSVFCCIGGGMPRDLLLQAARHLRDPLGIGEFAHDAAVEVSAPGRLRVAARLRRESAANQPELHEVELAPAIALPVLAALLLEEAGTRTTEPLLGQIDEMVDQLRQQHLRANLERQQVLLQQKVKATGAQLQARVHEQQSWIQNKIEETQATFQAEMTRAQQQIQRLLLQVRLPGDRESDDSNPPDPGRDA